VALQRCLKYIEQDTGVKYIPESDDTALPDFPGIASTVMPTETIKK
jgi:tetratricopeptide (TPR) repeat protein